jgi:hypothetical protein
MKLSLARTFDWAGATVLAFVLLAGTTADDAHAADTAANRSNRCMAGARMIGVMVDMRDHGKPIESVYRAIGGLADMSTTEAAYWGAQAANVYLNSKGDKTSLMTAHYIVCMGDVPPNM